MDLKVEYLLVTSKFNLQKRHGARMFILYS